MTGTLIYIEKARPEDVAEAVLYAASATGDSLISRVEVRHILPRE
jgi:NADP-dependent 3-hydroxy acid dehydrogenase YdfG